MRAGRTSNLMPAKSGSRVSNTPVLGRCVSACSCSVDLFLAFLFDFQLYARKLLRFFHSLFLCVFLFRYFGNTRNAFIEGKNEIRTGRLLLREKSQEFIRFWKFPVTSAIILAKNRKGKVQKPLLFLSGRISLQIEDLVVLDSNLKR